MAAGNMREIKNKVTSVKSTQKITKAMEMVSSAKFKKFNKLVVDSRAYYNGIEGVLKNIASGTKSEHHPLFEMREDVKKVGIIVIASDRGLCGGFNHNMVKEMKKLMAKKEEEGKDVSVIAVGKKVRDQCKKDGINMKAEYIQLIPEELFDKAKELSENIIEFYLENIYDEVYLIYSKFESALVSIGTVKQLIPVERIESVENSNYLFEPDTETILDILLPKYLNITLYQALLESLASEHSSRMRAMKSATDNAGEMIGKLTLAYNRARQASITQELAEIVAGAEAQK